VGRLDQGVHATSINSRGQGRQ